MSANSFAKIDMSLDDIIKLNRKEKKKTLSAKNATTGKKLTVAQNKRAETLKSKARNMKMNKLKGQNTPGRRRTPAFKTNIAKKSNIARRGRTGMTRGGKVNVAKNRQLNRNKGPQLNKNKSLALQQSRRPIAAPKSSRGRPTVQDRLGVRINSAQRNQKTKRQQLMNRNRRGLASAAGNRGAGRQASSTRRNQANTFRKNNVQRGRNRQYNQQPRGPIRQQSQRGRGGQNRRQQQTQQRNTKYIGNTQRQRITNNNRGRGAGRRGRGGAQRSVTLY